MTVWHITTDRLTVVDERAGEVPELLRGDVFFHKFFNLYLWHLGFD